MKLKKEKGSVLVLTIIAVLILSIMVTGLLNVGTTEIYTTQNFHLKKVAYYTAVQGVEEIRNKIVNAPDPQSIETIVKMPPASAYTTTGGYLKYYVTGSLKDLEEILAGTNPNGAPPQEFLGFDAPPLEAISMGQGTSIIPTVWKIQVTAKIDANKRSTYSEILTGIRSITVTKY
jgi:hypothetical protein